MLDGMTQLGEQFHPSPGGDAPVFIWRVNHEARMGVFGSVHRDVGMAQHGSQFAAVFRAEGDADAGVGLHVQPVE